MPPVTSESRETRCSLPDVLSEVQEIRRALGEIATASRLMWSESSTLGSNGSCRTYIGVETMGKPVFEIDGRRFDTLEGFFDEVERKLIPNVYWGRNLAAFNDILRGGFGTPEGGFVLRWAHSTRSREALGFPETVQYVEEKMTRCHTSNVPSVQADLEAARRGEGQTLFEILVDIIRVHCKGGREQNDEVELELA